MNFDFEGRVALKRVVIVATSLFVDLSGIVICRCPDCTGIKQKMKYASSSEYLKKAFSGIQHFECHDLDEFSYKEIAEELRKKDRQ